MLIFMTQKVNQPNVIDKMSIHERDDNLDFDEHYHVYKLKGSDIKFDSVTSTIHNNFSKFDPKLAVKNIIGCGKYSKDPTYKYYQKSQEQILAEWALTRSKGTDMHRMIECYFKQEPFEKGEEFAKEISLFEKFLQEENDLKIYRSEWRIYDEDLGIAGTIDAIFKRGNDFIILDWKRIANLNFESPQKSKTLPHLRDCNYNHYSLQLNLYRRILQRKYEIDAKELYIALIHPDNDECKLYRVPLMDKDIDTILKDREEKYQTIKRI